MSLRRFVLVYGLLALLFFALLALTGCTVQTPAPQPPPPQPPLVVPNPVPVPVPARPWWWPWWRPWPHRHHRHCP
jgi:hypothetical protein